MSNLMAFIYHETTKRKIGKLIQTDNREYQPRCMHGTHEFPPHSDRCACGKYHDNIQPDVVE